MQGPSTVDQPRGIGRLMKACVLVALGALAACSEHPRLPMSVNCYKHRPQNRLR